MAGFNRRFTRLGKPVLALGKLPFGKMNKTEEAYDAYLKSLMLADKIAWYKFEAIKLRLADNTFYTIDFAVVPTKTMVLEMHEVKGFWQDAARVKIKVAASQYPFVFVAVTARAKKHGGGWQYEEFSNGGADAAGAPLNPGTLPGIVAGH